jgi:hypothetical protein
VSGRFDGKGPTFRHASRERSASEDRRTIAARWRISLPCGCVRSAGRPRFLESEHRHFPEWTPGRLCNTGCSPELHLNGLTMPPRLLPDIRSVLFDIEHSVTLIEDYARGGAN